MTHRKISSLLAAGCSFIAMGGWMQPAFAVQPDDQVLVALRPGVDPFDVLASSRITTFAVSAVWRHAINGFAARIPHGSVVSLRHDSRVLVVEPDRGVTLAASPSSWGLDRVDQHTLPLDKHYAPFADGSGVTAYVIDTGIRLSHHDFGGRASSGADFVDGGSADDCQGHGTHVAGTIGGTTYGVAPKVSLVAVRVMDCDGRGPTSQIISGVEWVQTHHEAGAPAVANLSLGGAPSAVLDQAVRNLIDSGVTVVAAAGNGDANGRAQSACDVSPARVHQVVTVSAVDATDYRAPWAGYGSCVDLFAPGVDIVSDGISSDSTHKTMSGTSMAAPHATGAAALVLSQDPSATPSVVSERLRASGTKSVVKDARTSGPRLLFVGGGGGSSW